VGEVNLSTTVQTRLYVYYGNSAAVNQENVAGVGIRTTRVCGTSRRTPSRRMLQVSIRRLRAVRFQRPPAEGLEPERASTGAISICRFHIRQSRVDSLPSCVIV
jgi:hypothetical protein